MSARGEELKKILVIGYGNPGREDDGIGPALAARIEALDLPHVTAYDPYQLSIEDAVDIARQDIIWFIDAAREGYEPFEAHPLAPSQTIAIESHHLPPQVLLAIAQTYCGKAPEAWLLGVRGYTFEFHIGLSARAQANLELAFAYIHERIAFGATVSEERFA